MFSWRFRQASGRCGRGFGAVLRRYLCPVSLLLILVLGTFTALAVAQDQGSSAPSKGQTEPPDAAGGPNSDVGPYAIPKKKDEPPPPPPTGEAKEN